MKTDYRPGDPVIFRVTKQSTDPGPRAVDVHPAQSGETYSYQVDKFWTVGEVISNSMIQLVTRRGKQRMVSKDDLRLRRARWWERWLYGDRFPKLSQINDLTSTRHERWIDSSGFVLSTCSERNGAASDHRQEVFVGLQPSVC